MGPRPRPSTLPLPLPLPTRLRPYRGSSRSKSMCPHPSLSIGSQPRRRHRHDATLKPRAALFPCRQNTIHPSTPSCLGTPYPKEKPHSRAETWLGSGDGRTYERRPKTWRCRTGKRTWSRRRRGNKRWQWPKTSPRTRPLPHRPSPRHRPRRRRLLKATFLTSQHPQRRRKLQWNRLQRPHQLNLKILCAGTHGPR